MSHFQKESGGSVTVHLPRSPSVSCRTFPMYKDGRHFLSPRKSETGGAQHTGAPSCTAVSSETAPRAQLEACPPEEHDEENLAKRSSVE